MKYNNYIHKALFFIGVGLILCVTGCSIFKKFTAELSADIEVTNWSQTHYSWGYSTLVDVNYTIRNTGNVDIDHCKVYFGASFATYGSVHAGLDWTIGPEVPAGRVRSDSCYISVDEVKVTGVKVTSAELTNYEYDLTAP